MIVNQIKLKNKYVEVSVCNVTKFSKRVKLYRQSSVCSYCGQEVKENGQHNVEAFWVLIIYLCGLSL